MNKYIFPIFISLLMLLIVFSVIYKNKNTPILESKFIPEISLSLSASSSIAVLYTATSSNILYAKNPDLEIPIASITKLFTAYVSSTSDLFWPMLIESSNEAAQKVSGKTTIQNMNDFALKNNLTHTTFFNPNGLDLPGPNISSAHDLANAMHIMYETVHGKEIFTISKTITSKATNKALTDPRIPFEILGGKTGETAKAGQALTLITKGIQKNTYIVFVVLGSKNRFEDMVLLTNWVHEKIN